MVTVWRGMGRNTRIMAVAMMLWAVGEGLWLHIQPLYLSALDASSEQTGFILAMSGLARLLLMLPAGFLADRYGARAVMLPGWYFGFFGVVLIAAASNFYVLGLGFFLYGCSSYVIPIINLYLVQSIKADQSVQQNFSPQQILTFIYALFGLAQIVSPFIGGILADWLSLRAVFWFSAFWFALSTIAVIRTEVYARTSEEHRSWRAYGDMLRQQHLMVIYSVFTLALIATTLGYTFAPQYLEDMEGLSISVIGLLGSVLAAGSFIWNIWLGHRQEWTGFLSGTAITTFAFAMMIVSSHIVIVVPAFFLMGALFALRPLAAGIIAMRTDARIQGAALAVVDTLYGLATFVAPGIAGILYAQGTNWPFIASIAMLPLIFLLIRTPALHYTNTSAPEYTPQQ